MLAHYLTVAFAKFAKAPLTTAANVLTLALGLACFFAAYGVATYWRSADAQHHDADRIFVIGQTNTIKGQDPVPMHAISSWTLAKYLREDFPELAHVARAARQDDVAVAAGANKALFDVAIADLDFLRIFDLDFIAGDPRTALDQPGGVVLTQDAARRLFGDGPALGQSVLVNASEEGVVTGVIAPVRQPSFMGAADSAVFKFDMLRNWASSGWGAEMDGFESWVGLTPYTFVELPPSLSAEAFNARLPAFLERRIPANVQDVAKTEMTAFPIADLTTFDLDRSLFSNSAAGVSAVVALLALAGLTLLVACVNYANLATAQAAGRSKEIGMRKVLGAGRAQVMAQTWLEAGLLTLAAAGVAIGAVALATPAIRSAAGVDPIYFLSQGAAPAGALAGVLLLVAFAAGAYPAFALSGVRPAEALQSARSRSGPKAVARILVGVQFATASFLLILVTVTQLQREHLEQTVLAPRQDPVVILNDLTTIGVDYDTLAARLAGRPGVKSVSVVDWAPWGGGYNGVQIARSEDGASNAGTVFDKNVGYDYFATMNLKVLAGRVFDRTHDTVPESLVAFDNDPSRTLHMVVDARFVRRLGFASPQAAVGQIVYLPSSFTGRSALPVEIIGVTEAETTALEADAGTGTVYTYFPRAFYGGQHPVVRIARDDVRGAVAQITDVWNAVAPSVAVNIQFYDDLFEQSFRQYARIGQIFIILAGSAFVIASVGQLGIAVHVVSRRRHEIGVRKTLGATTVGIFRLLLVDFSKPVLIANLLAWPLGYVAAEAYLSAFADRVALTPAPFALSMAITLAIAWAAVLGEVLKAASVRPAEVLRHA